MHWQGYTYNRGIYYACIGWILTTIALAAVTIRIYSRTFLTRSIGSDDFTILVSMVLTFAGEINDTIAVSYGLGRHSSLLNADQYSEVQKWEYVDWIKVFVSYFFLRASIMLFVLRLLPPNKKPQQRIIFIIFFLNFAITIAATVSYGIKCIPFTAVYKSVPNAKCLSEQVLTSTQYVNAALACLIDITTALIPQFLLWNVKMKRTTKLFLDLIFGLGLITAGLSIGRAAATNNGIWKEDSTWRSMPSDTFSLVEARAGIIFASCPAIRQFFAYRKRVGTFLPSNERQPPNGDFVKMRRKINIRDILWYRKPIVTDGRVIDAKPIFQRIEDIEDMPETAQSNAEKSPLNVWNEKLRRNLSKSDTQSCSQDTSNSVSSRKGLLDKLGLSTLWNRTTSSGGPLSNGGVDQARHNKPVGRGQRWPGLSSDNDRNNIAMGDCAWGLPDGIDSRVTGNERRSLGDASGTDANMGVPERSHQDVDCRGRLGLIPSTRSQAEHTFPRHPVRNA